ncbi:hypothetical protein [Cohnella sp. GCM10027633]|uniref:hypothetical protein n=1 Tax=unclassified Cohnella TaxID=2636738 RepID=UPI0036335C21
MSTIPNFPQSLLEEHARWHHEHHLADPSRVPIGHGLAFLQFHRDYINRALAWYNQTGNNPSLVMPWAAVPEPIRRASCYDQSAEARILFQPESFATADELGRFLESSGIHGCIHREAARLYGEPEIDDFDVAPRNTVFYNIHGMINRWYQNWEGLGRFQGGVGHWCGPFEESDDEVLYYRESDRTWWLGRSQQPGGQDELRVAASVEWAAIGDSLSFGPLADGRPFRVWDIDGDGKLEVVFHNTEDGFWREGKIKDGRLHWQPIRLRG